MARDPTRRFSDRVADYVRFRPGYPPALVDRLRDAGALPDGALVADVGCGTGKLAEPLLRAGHRVVGVEPNGPMREAARRLLGREQRFELLDGRAEATGLDDGSVDLVTAGQAFHWFEPIATAAEWRRILRPAGRAALIWNDRVADDDGPMAAYESLMREHGTDYEAVRGGRVAAADIDAFFGGEVRTERLAHTQEHDLTGLIGRVLSCSYIPGPDEPGHAALRDAIEREFARHARDGRFPMRYECIAHVGRPVGRSG